MADAYDLMAAARAKFGELSAAEEKLLRCAQSGDVAYCGPSEKNDDPENDPAKADGWGKKRTIRARLIRWLCIDSEASKHVDPRGIQIHAARIGDPSNENALDLSAAFVSFPLNFLICSFQLPLWLPDAKIPRLNLTGTQIPGLEADRVNVFGSVFLKDRFHAEGEVRLMGAEIGGDLECEGGTFVNENGGALHADGIKVAGSVFLRDKFSARGEVRLLGAVIGVSLDCSGGTFVNKGGFALNADSVKVSGNVFLRNKFSVEGEVRFRGAEIGGQLDCSGAHFGDASGLNLENATVKQAFLWRGLGSNSPVSLNLGHASVGPFADEEQSWPRKGNLLLDGFVYQRIGAGPTSAEKRLEWLARQPDGFVPQPYRQLAKVLRERGDDAGARKVLIAMENARLRFGGLSAIQRAASWILWATVGYGYTPLRALGWIVGFVLLGTILFSWGDGAGVMAQVDKKDSSAQLEPFNPFIFSLENFLPLVDLHMAKHWMPDPNATPVPLFLPFSDSAAPVTPSLGRYLRCYLWAHILLGWFFTSMFIAGITGLVRRE